MAQTLTIDLYDCDPRELEDHVSNPHISMQTLEFYVKETLKLIDRQKAEDKAAESPRSRGSRARRDRTKSSDAMDNIDAISLTSSTTSSRPVRRTRGRKQSESHTNPRRTSRKTSRSNRMVEPEDESDEEDMELDEFVPPTDTNKPSNSVEYDWFSGVDIDDGGESSSLDPLLQFDPTNLDNDTFDTLLFSDKATAKPTAKSKKSSKKKKKKKHKSSKEKKKKKKKHKKKLKNKRHKRNKDRSNESDDDYMLSSDEDDYDNPMEVKRYEQRVASWSLSQLEKEQKSLERQIEMEHKKSDHHKHTTGASASALPESENEIQELNKLSLDELQMKFANTFNDIKGTKMQHLQHAHTEDPTKLYCICRKPYDGTTQMICCDYCQEWYHLSCIGLSADKLASVEQLKFKCPVCNGADPNDITNKRHIGEASFDSPKSTPNPQHMTHPAALAPMGANALRAPSTIATNTHMAAMHVTGDKRKYERLLMEFQLRLKECKLTLKKEKKEMNERLARAKHDIDEERRLRIAIEKHMEGAKKKSDSMVKELGESFKHQKEKEAELVNKLKKLETNKKKYKDSASENKKKMKQLREEHENRLHELEDESMTLNEKLSAHKKKYNALDEKFESLKQQHLSQQQQTTNTMNNTYAQYNKLKQQLDNKSAEAQKLHNLNSQLKHRMDALHVQAQQNHQQWENIAKVKADKMERLEKQLTALQQQNNALRSNNNMPVQTQQQMVNHTSSNSSGGNTPRPPSPIKMPATPGYLKFNDLELEELKMCRELCQKLLEANLFQVEHMAARAQLTRDLFVSWVTGMGGKSPTVINDLNQATMGTLPQLDPQQHLSMNCIRLLLIEIRKQLENIVNDTGSHDIDTINKVKSLLREFQTASQSYEQKMTEFKRIQHDRLLEGCRSQGSVLEMFVVVGSNENNEPKSEWINVTVCNFDGPNNRVLVRKSNDQSMAYAAIDAATLRLPENVQNKAILNGVAATSNSISNSSATNSGNNNMMTQQPSSSYWNANANNTSGMSAMVPGMTFNTAQMNFNGIPAIPAFPGANTILPPFNDLQANNIGNQHHISNTINTNNNISINGATTHDPIVIGDEEDSNNNKVSTRNKHHSHHTHTASSSRKRKREDRLHTHKKKKKSKHKNDDRDDDDDDDTTESDTSSDDSDISSDSETDSDSAHHSRSKRKKKKKSKKRSKKHKKSKKSKKSSKKSKKKSSKKVKNGRKRSKRGDEENRSVSVSSTASTRKRRGTKRQLPNSAKTNGGASHHTNVPNKRRKIDHVRVVKSLKAKSKQQTDYDVIDGGGDSDKNDSVCRICKHPGDLVCCEGCPSAYHADCIRPRVKPEWLDSFEDWYCPSCAPRFSYVPVKYIKTGQKWPQNKEPLLKNLKDFLKRHPFLERDYKPQYHASRKHK